MLFWTCDGLHKRRAATGPPHDCHDFVHVFDMIASILVILISDLGADTRWSQQRLGSRRPGGVHVAQLKIQTAANGGAGA